MERIGQNRGASIPGKEDGKIILFFSCFYGGRLGSSLPLTLTLSPQAGRGDVPRERLLVGEKFAAYLRRPVYGEKVAGRPDEGHVPQAVTLLAKEGEARKGFPPVRSHVPQKVAVISSPGFGGTA